MLFRSGDKVMYSVTLVPGGTIMITPDNILLPYIASSGQFTVTCTDGDGVPDPTMAWTLTSNNAWCTMSLNADGTGASTTLSSTGDQTVYVFAPANAGSANRTALITMGGSTQVTVTQLPNPGTISGGGTAPTNTTTYVGAFWRSTQMGERVIKIDIGNNAGNRGDWSASVMYMDSKWSPGEIVLANGDSDDPDIRSASHADAELYPVLNGSQAITGTVGNNGSIIFRIGLTNTWSAFHDDTNPARYAVVLLSYNNNTKHQKIYLRQGEGADVIRPGTSIKWSPYTIRESSNASGRIVLTAANAAFTEFPTQAGYAFRWNNLTALSTDQNVTSAQWAAITLNTSYKAADDPCTLVDGGRFRTINASNASVSWGLPETFETGMYADGWADRELPPRTNYNRPHVSYGARVHLFIASTEQSLAHPLVQGHGHGNVAVSANWGQIMGASAISSPILCLWVGVQWNPGTQTYATKADNAAPVKCIRN